MLGAVANRPPRTPATRPALALAALCLGALAGCGDDAAAGDVERFCGEVTEHRDELVAPRLGTSADIAPLLDLYRTIGAVAPLEIEPAWQQLVTSYETASTVVPGDAESEQVAIAVALRSEASAAEVATWVREHCEVELGPVATLVPHGG